MSSWASHLRAAVLWLISDLIVDLQYPDQSSVWRMVRTAVVGERAWFNADHGKLLHVE